MEAWRKLAATLLPVLDVEQKYGGLSVHYMGRDVKMTMCGPGRLSFSKGGNTKAKLWVLWSETTMHQNLSLMSSLDIRKGSPGLVVVSAEMTNGRTQPRWAMA